MVLANAIERARAVGFHGRSETERADYAQVSRALSRDDPDGTEVLVALSPNVPPDNSAMLTSATTCAETEQPCPVTGHAGFITRMTR